MQYKVLITIYLSRWTSTRYHHFYPGFYCMTKKFLILLHLYRVSFTAFSYSIYHAFHRAFIVDASLWYAIRSLLVWNHVYIVVDIQAKLIPLAFLCYILVNLDTFVGLNFHRRIYFTHPGVGVSVKMPR